MKRILIFFITIYQKTLSPDHGLLKVKYPYGFCRFYPSCSEYAKQAILRHGTFYGTGKALRRVLMCNPFVDPSIDPLN